MKHLSFKKCRDLILGIVMLAFSAFYLYFTFQIKTRPKLTPSYASARVMPTILGVLLAIMAILCIVQGVRKLKEPDDGKVEEKADILTVALTFAVIIGYIFIMQPLGFCLSTVIYLFLQMLVLAPAGKRNIALFAIISVVFTVVIFFAFRVGLDLLLPRGIIESLIGF